MYKHFFKVGGILQNKKVDQYLFLSWAIAVIALFGSLYFSEIRKFEPCELCWYQRIFMYPLTIILGIAYVKKDWKISFYTMILSAIGGSISLYHYSLQKFLLTKEGSLFCGRIPCHAQYIDWFGFITIPFLALTAFIIIFILSMMIWRKTMEGMNS